MVLEIPPAGKEASITGSIDEAWQTAIEDVGPAGVDKGKGGKYLILPPGYKQKRFRRLHSSDVGNSTPALCSFAPTSRAAARTISPRLSHTASASSFIHSCKQSNPPPTKFVDAVDIVFDSTIPYDVRFFQTLDRFVQREPWLERDKVMIDQLKTIGIKRGKPFNPDADTQKILSDAAGEAHAWLNSQVRETLLDAL